MNVKGGITQNTKLFFLLSLFSPCFLGKLSAPHIRFMLCVSLSRKGRNIRSIHPSVRLSSSQQQHPSLTCLIRFNTCCCIFPALKSPSGPLFPASFTIMLRGEEDSSLSVVLLLLHFLTIAERVWGANLISSLSPFRSIE